MSRRGTLAGTGSLLLGKRRTLISMRLFPMLVLEQRSWRRRDLLKLWKTYDDGGCTAVLGRESDTEVAFAPLACAHRGTPHAIA